MAVAFFFDVLNVDLYQKENKKNPGTFDTYARLQLAGGTLDVRVKVGVKIQSGYQGQAFGSCRIVSASFTYQGRSFSRPVLTPYEIETWVQGAPVQSAALSVSKFLTAK